MEASSGLLQAGHEILVRAASDPETATRPPVYKAIGITLAISSGLFIGTSFVLKKVGLLRANVKYNEEAGEGYGYLKNAYWWTGMTLMILGEVCNFVAYAFVDAILVTPLGALSVVITTILSAIFLKERLSFVGKVGCFICIIGSIVIVMNAPAQSSAATIQEMRSYVIAPGFLSYAGVVILGCAFIAWWAGPRYGKKTMMVYLSICSLIGGLSVVATQGLGAAVVAQAGGTPQFNQWFLYVLLVFVVCTLLTEIIYLNKALNLFNAALVTPTYYVCFTSATIVSSSILFRGFSGTPTAIATVVMGFLQICAGVILLQLSKSAKDVPDAAVFTGDLDQVRTVAEQEQPESEPKADAIRGAAAIVRRISKYRQKKEADEAKRVYEDKMKDQMEPIGENEEVHWDGLRRRKTTIGSSGSLHRRKTLHPPLGMTHFPDPEHETQATEGDGDTSSFGGSFLKSLRRPRGRTGGSSIRPETATTDNQTHPYNSSLGSPRKTFTIPEASTAYTNQPVDAMELTHVYGLPEDLQQPPPPFDGTRSPQSSLHKPIAWAPDVEDRPRSKDSFGSHQMAKRQFSFQNVFHRNRAASSGSAGDTGHPLPRKPLGPRTGSRDHAIPGGIKNVTEEERMGLVKGDSNFSPLVQEPEEDESQFTRALTKGSSGVGGEDEKEMEAYEVRRNRWSEGSGKRRRGEDSRSGSEHDLLGYQDLVGKKGGGAGSSGGAFI